MSKAYRNFWSLNVDEAVVSGILRDETVKNVEVLFPLNSQMKDVDLFLLNLKNKKVATIQVKSSRAYEPKKSEIDKYEYGSAGWFYFKKEVVLNSAADYFIFLIYVLEESKEKGRRIIVPHTITIESSKLIDLCLKNKKSDSKGLYSFFIWVNPKEKKAFDFRDQEYSLSDYLDKKGFEKLNLKLK